MKVQLLNEIWTVIDPRDESTWPEGDQAVYYIFTPLGDVPVFEGFFFIGTHNEKPHGGFSGKGGFCDWHDAPFWRPREESEDG